jgi:hypothetical protein
MTARFVTTAPAGPYGPGLIIDVTEITAAAPVTPRDGWTGGGGDGQWLRVRHPNGILIRMLRTPAELTSELSIDLADLQEVTS